MIQTAAQWKARQDAKKYAQQCQNKAKRKNNAKPKKK